MLLTQFDLRVPWTFLLTEMPGVLKISVLKKTLPGCWLGPSCWHSQTCLLSSDFHLQSRGESEKEYCTSRSMITNVCSNTSFWSAHGNTSFENHSSKASGLKLGPWVVLCEELLWQKTCWNYILKLLWLHGLNVQFDLKYVTYFVYVVALQWM